MSEGQINDFADCAAGLSVALRRIADGFTALGDQHFQDVAKEALDQWGYFPPKPPPNYGEQREKLRADFLDALSKVMAMLHSFNDTVSQDRDRYRERALAAEGRIQELLRVIAAESPAEVEKVK